MPIDRIILHSTRGRQVIGVEAQATIGWFLNPRSEASAHLLITQAGEVIRFVRDFDQAWGAGKENNQRSLQVELEQPDNDTPFSEKQIDRLVEALKAWGARHGIPLDAEHVMGHDQTEQGKAMGKSDPGRMFDWHLIWRLLA